MSSNMSPLEFLTNINFLVKFKTLIYTNFQTIVNKNDDNNNQQKGHQFNFNVLKKNL